MEKEQHELYEYARKRLNQKKALYFHFVLLILGSIFMSIANYFLVFGYTSNWSIWIITFWLFLFLLHFIKVYITDRFMNKNWEREQVDRLVGQQQRKIDQLQTHIEEESSKKPQ
ncbi:2TM domain-containing protein [Flavobacterium soyangense]|uniref:2TM domain-containing protein n=1 Tax=Flavobacterium soyangense TaxID=2023265 RepID=A0A930UBR1_9FLAO|nr:2TM domain-containing protein [Flavobacterium soyangense]MBF2707922.1 2TM domain-containing protein [Flavobacterium soyangense]